MHLRRCAWHLLLAAAVLPPVAGTTPAPPTAAPPTQPPSSGCPTRANCRFYDAACSCAECNTGYRLAADGETCEVSPTAAPPTARPPTPSSGCPAVENCRFYAQSCECAGCNPGYTESGGRCIVAAPTPMPRTAGPRTPQPPTPCPSVQRCRTYGADCSCLGCVQDYVVQQGQCVRRTTGEPGANPRDPLCKINDCLFYMPSGCECMQCASDRRLLRGLCAEPSAPTDEDEGDDDFPWVWIGVAAGVVVCCLIACIVYLFRSGASDKPAEPKESAEGQPLAPTDAKKEAADGTGSAAGDPIGSPPNSVVPPAPLSQTAVAEAMPSAAQNEKYTSVQMAASPPSRQPPTFLPYASASVMAAGSAPRGIEPATPIAVIPAAGSGRQGGRGGPVSQPPPGAVPRNVVGSPHSRPHGTPTSPHTVPPRPMPGVSAFQQSPGGPPQPMPSNRGPQPQQPQPLMPTPSALAPPSAIGGGMRSVPAVRQGPPPASAPPPGIHLTPASTEGPLHMPSTGGQQQPQEFPSHPFYTPPETELTPGAGPLPPVSGMVRSAVPSKMLISPKSGAPQLI